MRRADYTKDSIEELEGAKNSFVEVCHKVIRTFDLDDERRGWIDYRAMTEELSNALEGLAGAWEALEEKG